MTYSENIGYRIKHLQMAMRARMDTALAKENLTTPQYAALVALSGMPTLTNAELARRCFVTPQTMHRITVTLKKNGLLRTIDDPSDAKRLQLAVTLRAKQLLERSSLRVLALEHQMLEGLSASDTQRMRDLLDKCILNVTDNRTD